MTKGQPERRSGRRIPAEVPVSIRSTDGEKTGHTRDLSSNGVFLYTDANLTEGSALELVLMLPPELAHGTKRWACCQASVLRVEEGTRKGQLGLAASITKLEILPEIPE